MFFEKKLLIVDTSKTHGIDSITATHSNPNKMERNLNPISLLEYLTIEGRRELIRNWREFMQEEKRAEEELRKLSIEERRAVLERKREEERKREKEEREEQERAEQKRRNAEAIASNKRRQERLEAEIRQARERFEEVHGRLPVDDNYKVMLAKSMGICTNEIPERVVWLSANDDDARWGFAFDYWRFLSEQEEKEWLQSLQEDLMKQTPLP